MLLIDLLRSQVSVRVYVRVTHPNFEKCRSLSLPWGRKLSPRKSVVQSACQYDVTSCFSDKMASKVFIDETDKKFDFITEILLRFLGFGDFKVSIVIEN